MMGLFSKDKKDKAVPGGKGKKAATKKQEPETGAEKLPDILKPVPLNISRLMVIDDSLAKREITTILKRMDTEGISLEDSITLLVRAVVDHSIDLTEVRKAFKTSAASMADYIEMLMVGQAMKHLAAEVESSKQLDALVPEMIAIVRTPAMDSRIKVSAFNALVGWRDKRIDYPFKVAKLIQDTRLVDRVTDIFQNFVKLAKTGSDEWEQLLADMPVQERQEMALIVSWMVQAQGLDLKAIEAHLEQPTKP